MTLLAPLGLLGLLSIPVLLWLWRLASTQRRLSVPSLIPFEHLLRRPVRRRTQLVVNLLFWLQLATLLGLTLALAQPVLLRKRVTTTLVLFDTSASMGAHRRGRSRFEQAKQALLSRVARSSAAEQLFVVTTAPLAPILPQPTSDTTALTHALQTLQATHLGGNLGAAMHLGRALLSTEPDETVVVTDEVAPEETSEPRSNKLERGEEPVRWIRVGEPSPNVAIVGIDAQQALCVPTGAHGLVTVQNFSDKPTAVTVTALQRGRPLDRARAELAPRARSTLPLALPQDARGELEIALEAPDDSLEVDNHAWMEIRPTASLPIVVRAQNPMWTTALSTWLAACPTLPWSVDAPSAGSPYLLITDQEGDLPPPEAGPPPADLVESAAVAVLFVRTPTSPEPTVGSWVVSSTHPIGSYLSPVELVAARLDPSGNLGMSGVPVVSGLIKGRKVPLVVADEVEGRRVVWMLFAPAEGQASPPVVMTFFNSLRWLMGEGGTTTVGEPLVLGGLSPGTVRVHRPDGSIDDVQMSGGLLRYEATTVAGTYRVRQGSVEVAAHVNAFNPLESNLLDPPSTWIEVQRADIPERRTMPDQSTRPRYPLAPLVMMLLLLLLLAEWRLYRAKRISP